MEFGTYSQKEKGKVRPFKILENTLKCQEVFNKIGLQEKINDDGSTEIEK